MLGVLAALVFAALVVGGLIVGGVLRFGAESPAPNLQAKVSTPPPSLPVTAKSEPLTPEERVEMPADVYAWLEHLRQTEERRGQLSLQNLGEAKALMMRTYASAPASMLKELLGDASGSPEEIDVNPKPPEQKEFQDVVAPMRAQWEELLAFYRSVPPPAECQPIAATYDPVLLRTGNRILELLEIIQNAPTDPDAITKLSGQLEASRGQSRNEIGVPAQQTDQLVQSICDKYQTRKWFSIQADYGAGGMLSVGGLGL